MGHREKDNRAYFWCPSFIFNDAWLVVAREVDENGVEIPRIIADFGDKYAAKRVAKELNHAIEGKYKLVEEDE